MAFITESDIEQIALDVFHNDLGYDLAYGPDLAEGVTAERTHTDVVLAGRLQAAIARINPHIPPDARAEALKTVLRSSVGSTLEANEDFHRLLTEGVDVKWSIGEGRAKTDKVWLIDFAHPEQNAFLALNQFTVVEGQANKRPDIVIFVNGLPLVVLELKNATDEAADIGAAYRQLQTYKKTIPSLFRYNAFMMVSDGWFAKAGTLSAEWSRFAEWKTADGHTIVDTASEPEMEPMLKGLFNKRTLLDVIRHFIVFERGRERTVKKMAAYHQYYAVNRAIESTVRASAYATEAAAPSITEPPVNYGLPDARNQRAGDRRAGVVWHTQGSGKSLSMVFYTGKLVLSEAMHNPTIVVLTDRNDLDQQLFETFSACAGLIRQTPVQACSRDELKRLLAVASGGVVFTTIQKFAPDEPGTQYPLLSDRRNIVVVADEAHRSQYDFIDGFARHLRRAPCPARLSSALPARPSSAKTATPRPSSATTSTSTTSSRPWKTAPPCASTTKAGWLKSASRPKSKKSSTSAWTR